MSEARTTTAWGDAARVVRRSGFGGTGAAVDDAVRVGIQHYVASIVAADPAKDAGARATPMPAVTAIRLPETSADDTARKQARRQMREQMRTLTAWWVRRMATVDAPFVEKLTFCWHNHFATSAQKVNQASWMAAQNAALRRLGRGDFRTLGYAMLTDAAMLRWLDGQKNTVAAPNENLSREFMELFSLGHGYTETDVRQGARALTGWRISRMDGAVRFAPGRHDDGVKTFLGVTGDLDAAGYLDAILARPASAAFLAVRWWHQLASDVAPSPDVLDRLTAAYGDRRDLSALFTAILTDPAFAAAQGTTVVSPVEWLVGAVRTLKVPVATDAAALRIAGALRLLGELPFYPPSVGGWPSGQAWLSTAAADTRARAAQQLVQHADLSALDGSTPSRLDATAHLLGIASWSDRSAAVLRATAGNPQLLVATALNTPEYLTH